MNLDVKAREARSVVGRARTGRALLGQEQEILHRQSLIAALWGKADELTCAGNQPYDNARTLSSGSLQSLESDHRA